MMIENVKPAWQSKTLWVNFILASVAFFPSVQEHLSPEKVAAIFTAVNTVLRFITKDKLGI